MEPLWQEIPEYLRGYREGLLDSLNGLYRYPARYPEEPTMRDWGYRHGGTLGILGVPMLDGAVPEPHTVRTAADIKREPLPPRSLWTDRDGSLWEMASGHGYHCGLRLHMVMASSDDLADPNVPEAVIEHVGPLTRVTDLAAWWSERRGAA